MKYFIFLLLLVLAFGCQQAPTKVENAEGAEEATSEEILEQAQEYKAADPEGFAADIEELCEAAASVPGTQEARNALEFVENSGETCD